MTNILIVGGIILYKKIVIYFLLSVFLLTSCSNNEEKSNQTELLLYTSVYPIQFVIEQITGDEATVRSIYPPGVDAHTYEPTTKEVTAIANADAFIFIGGGMENFAETAAEALQKQNVQLVELSKQKKLFISSQTGEEANNTNKDLDPHIWLDPAKMIEISELIKDLLIELSPNNEEAFTHNFSNLKNELEELDKAYQNVLMEKEHKELLVTHAAYGYWENRYGIEQIAISGLSSSDEPSQKELANIARFALDKDIHYVLFEQTSSSRIGTIIQEYIQAEKLYIHPLEVLTEEDIKNNETYLTLMYKNLDMLDKATK